MIFFIKLHVAWKGFMISKAGINWGVRKCIFDHLDNYAGSAKIILPGLVPHVVGRKITSHKNEVYVLPNT